MRDLFPGAVTLLAATDFSPSARFAVARAALLAQERGGELIIKHVVNTDPWLALRDLVDERDIAGRVAEQARMALAAGASSIAREHRLVPHTEVASGRTVDELLAGSEAADLLVLGASGDHPVRHRTIGSTADRLARLARIPLLIVRGEPVQPWRQVVAAVDFSACSLSALRLARQLAPGAAFHLLHCIDVPTVAHPALGALRRDAMTHLRTRARERAIEQLEQLRSEFDAGRSVSLSVGEDDVRLEVLREADRRGADLISMGKQGQSLISDTLLGSVTASVLADALCDVLVVPCASAGRFVDAAAKPGGSW